MKRGLLSSHIGHKLDLREGEEMNIVLRCMTCSLDLFTFEAVPETVEEVEAIFNKISLK